MRYKINKKQQRIARLLLAVMGINLVSPYATEASNGRSGGGPVAAAASNMVDPFTGNFSYGVPLMTVPGPNGENVSITAGYSGGIRSEQDAGWIGLGWGYNPGEISRSIVGVGDDITNRVIKMAKSREPNASTGYFENYTHGPLYYKNLNVQNTYSGNMGVDFMKKGQDLSIQYKRLKKANSPDYTIVPFKFPNYDSYGISGPGIGGSIKPYLMSGALSASSKPGDNFSLTFPTGNTGNIPIEFYMEGSTTTATFDYTTNRFNSGTYIKYYTNSQINTSANLFSNVTHTGFLDYQILSGIRRPSAAFDDNGIGGFQVTTPGGVTYHYSLPVYTLDEFSLSFEYANPYTPNLNSSTKWDITRKPFRQATSWKLTAVTGADYEDSNNNYVVDEGDKGYWISYGYSKWCDNFNWSSSYFNFKTNMNNNGVVTGYGTYNINLLARKYTPIGNIVRGSSQLYYLDYIKTSTHTAFFVKDIRKDGHGYEKVLNPAAQPAPQLKLNRIVLMRNEDAILFTVGNTGVMPSVAGFNTSTCNTSGSDIIHMGKYNYQLSAINAKSLKMVEFDTDYSLCKKLYNNINNSFPTTRFLYSDPNTNGEYFVVNNNSTFIQESYNPVNGGTFPSDLNQSGKLTLRQILAYENGKVKIYPSYVFAYNKNPDYNPLATDNWGFYKSDYDISLPGNNTTQASKDNVDAWSLTQVTTPLGGTVNVTYESDEYTHEGDPNTLPSFIFPIASMTSLNTNMYIPNKDFSTIRAAAGNFHDHTTITIPTTIRCGNQSVLMNWFCHYHATVSSDVSGNTISNYSFQYTNGLHIVDDPNNLEATCLANYPLHTDAYNPPVLGYGYAREYVTKAYGGGIRVKEISITDPESNQSYKQQFTYTDGLCSVLPGKFAVDGYDLTDNQNLIDNDGVGPNVGYSKITAKTLSNSGQDNGYVEYLFNNEPAFAYALTGTESTSSLATVYFNANGTTYYAKARYFQGSVSKDYKQSQLYGKIKQMSSYDAANVLIAWSKSKYSLVNTITEAFGFHAATDPPMDFQTPVRVFQNVGQNAQNQNIGINPTYIAGHNYYLISSKRTKGIYVVNESESFLDGLSSKSYINARDPLTGNPTETMTIDPTAGAAITKTTYAYTDAAYTNVFGPKSACSSCGNRQNNLNAVSQRITLRYPIYRDAQGELQVNTTNSSGNLVGGTKTIFSNVLPIRKYNPATGKYETNSITSFLWLPAEGYELLTTASTPGNTLQANYEWRKINTMKTLTESYLGIEGEGSTGRRVGSKIGYNGQFPLCAGSDASYTSFAFSSFEDKMDVDPGLGIVYHFGGEVNGGNFQQASTTNVPAHTGNYVVKVPANSYGPGYVARDFSLGRTYRASIWVHKSSPDNAALNIGLDGTINGSPQYIWKSVVKSDPNNITVGDWILMRVDIDVPANYVQSGGPNNLNNIGFSVYNGGSTDAYFDDLKINPIDAPVSGNVYDAQTGLLKASIDADGFATLYEYDAAGRLTRSWIETDKGLKKVSENVYHFARP